MGQLITIDDSNYLQFVDPIVDGEQKKCGTLPRDFALQPQGFMACAKPFDLPLIDESEWPERIAEQEVQQSSLQHIRDKGMWGGRIPSRDQNGKGYCWAHSSVSAALLVRAFMNLPYSDLSAYAIACVIKGYRDEGGWGSESVQFIAERGVPSSQFWPQQSMSRSNDKAETWADAAKHRYLEWMDLAESGDLVRKQLGTALLCNIPVVVDFNWWSHSVCACRLVKANPFTIRIWNSWGDSWSDHGMGDLTGSKALPNGALACRVQTPSTV